MRQVVSRADRNEIRKGWHSVWVELISSHLSTVHLESRGVSITHDDYQAVTVVGAKWKKSKANGQNMHPDMEQNNTLCYYAHFLPSFFVPQKFDDWCINAMPLSDIDLHQWRHIFSQMNHALYQELERVHRTSSWSFCSTGDVCIPKQGFHRSNNYDGSSLLIKL